ncbi:MAG: hypothetical protein F4Y46_03685 [Chloroflexi bacterium]|nr:hypothetical protein [Chloroflexota bacterium]
MISDKAVLDYYSNGLNQFHNLAQRLHQSHGIHFMDGSQADRELNPHPRPELLAPAWSIASSQIEAAADYFAAFANMLAPSDGLYTPYAAYACVRSMLEPCAATLWLLDPTANARERTKRTFALRFEDIQQERKFAVACGQSGDKQEQRIAQVARSAAEIGFKPLTGKAGKTVAIGVHKPSPTELIQTQLGEEFWFRFLSAISHGKTWALRISSMQQVPVQAPQSTDPGGSTLFEKVVNRDLLVTVAVVATISIARALRSKFEYGGWDLEELDSGLESAFEVLKIPPKDRFWRPA